MHAAAPCPFDVRFTVSSCSRNATLSADSLASNSTIVWPRLAPVRRPASVFSGARVPPPRCAATRGYGQDLIKWAPGIGGGGEMGRAAPSSVVGDDEETAVLLQGIAVGHARDVMRDQPRLH